VTPRALLAGALVGAALVSGCDRLVGVGAPASPHGRYAEALRAAGLDTLAAGRLWLAAADSALLDPDSLGVPDLAALTFEAGRPRAWGARFALRAGERLEVRVVSALGDSARAFVDLFETGGGAPSLIEGRAAFGDTLRLTREVEADETVLVRVQPELLGAGAVRVEVETAPSLAFPVAGAGRADVGSVWADPRDGGARRHEGIDVFAERGTPVVAAAAGRVTRVQETPRGGRVVWLSPDDRPVSLYYAHLDTQLVADGAAVEVGDTLGRVGNTGNAAGTPPHLHFGIYGRGGAVDPSPFVLGRSADE
jgi:murein DD-endopeptidase MepM/ murein hydrolase activator NlpD